MRGVYLSCGRTTGQLVRIEDLEFPKGSIIRRFTRWITKRLRPFRRRSKLPRTSGQVVSHETGERTDRIVADGNRRIAEQPVIQEEYQKLEMQKMLKVKKEELVKVAESRAKRAGKPVTVEGQYKLHELENTAKRLNAEIDEQNNFYPGTAR